MRAWAAATVSAMVRYSAAARVSAERASAARVTVKATAMWEEYGGESFDDGESVDGEIVK